MAGHNKAQPEKNSTHIYAILAAEKTILCLGFHMQDKTKQKLGTKGKTIITKCGLCKALKGETKDQPFHIKQQRTRTKRGTTHLRSNKQKAQASFMSKTTMVLHVSDIIEES